jgi:hypothetical protein
MRQKILSNLVIGFIGHNVDNAMEAHRPVTGSYVQSLNLNKKKNVKRNIKELSHIVI